MIEPGGASARRFRIVNVGGQGIKAAGVDLHISHCRIHDVGACGIRFHGTRVHVTDNHIHHIGLTYPSAIALAGGGQSWNTPTKPL